ncbi:MAG TPA: hypothetical protein EYN96_12035 [Candidatus Hydrogenedentes bacterium]|nr:hypothetical protein [Candidatus Hydrogenedentota bacterium]
MITICKFLSQAETIAIGALLLAFSGPVFAAESADRKPNVIIILTDDQGWGDISSHGNENIETPVMDRIAAEGARFDRFYVSPVCSPTRASLLTGRYHNRMGVSGTSAGLETMALDEVTIAEVFKDGGYATGCFGKWHNGAHYPYHPNGRGFDEFFGFCLGHWNNYFDTTVEHNGKAVKTKGYINDVFTDAALDWIDDVHEKPFLCYIPYNTPHTPFQVPDKYFDKYKARGLDDALASAYGMCENLDDNIGRILDRLDKHNIADDTIVIFLGDNGPNGDRYNGGMRGRKGSVHEGGVRNAFLMRYPAKIKPGTHIETITAHIDVLPTLAELAGLDTSKTLPLDGISFVPLLEGKTMGWPDRLIFSEWRGKGSARSQQYRMAVEGGKPQLYDMIADPGEKNDIAKKKPQITNQLKKAYDEWDASFSHVSTVPPPIPIGHDEMKTVILTCSEGIWEGELDWGGKHPNNNWATNWMSTDCVVSWEVDIVTAGKYSVALEYICPETDLGSTVYVEVAGKRVEGRIDRAHEPNYLPSPDRVPRKEVYERTWGHKELGSFELPKGRSRMTVKATTKSGKAVMDLKSVQITRVD